MNVFLEIDKQSFIEYINLKYISITLLLHLN